MKKISKRKIILPWKWILLGLLLALLSGVAGELLFNWNSLTNPDPKGNQVLDNAAIEYEGAVLQEGMFASQGKEMRLRVKLPGQYVHKLSYTYMSPYVNVDANIVVHTNDGYGQETVRVLQDKNSILRDFSVVRINERVDEIELQFAKPSDGFVLSSISINDAPSFSKMRFAFFAAAALLLYLILLLGRLAARRLEVLFLLLLLPVGGLMILGLSPREASWDEHIHFYRAYSLMYDLTGEDTMPVSEHMYTYMNTGMANEPFYFPRSQEENAQERAYGDEGLWEQTEAPELYQETNGLHLYSVAYLPQMLLLAVGRLLQVPFWILVALGRLGNLICYGILCFFAIRHLKRGKALAFLIALFPTSVFLAATYSYDAFINGCMLLGMSYLFTELMEKERPVSMKNLSVFLISVILGSMPKAVYIPLILLGLLLPARRFSDKRVLWGYRILVLVALLALLATFVLPAAGSGGGGMAGDPRGGDTSVSRQMGLIFSHPFAYASLLLRSIWENLPMSLFGQSVAGNLAYRGALSVNAWMCPFVIFVIFTDRYGEHRRELGKWQRIFTGVLLFGVICLIWTALYLSFTPVGLQQINGVQPRYYLPLLLPLYLSMQVSGVKNLLKPERYYQIVAAGCLFFLLNGLWNGVITMCF